DRQVQPVHDHPRPLQRDEPAADHLIQLGEDRSNSLLCIHTLDDYRQVERENLDPIGAELGTCAVTHDRAKHGRASVVLLAQQLDNRLVKCSPLPAIPLADMDPHQGALSLKAVHSVVSLHQVLRTVTSLGLQPTTRIEQRTSETQPRDVPTSDRATLRTM